MPQLEELYLGGVIASDQELAIVVCQLPPSLKQFGLESGDFGPLCFRHLQERCFGTLVTLDLEGCNTFTSRALVELSSVEAVQGGHHFFERSLFNATTLGVPGTHAPQESAMTTPLTSTKPTTADFHNSQLQPATTPSSSPQSTPTNRTNNDTSKTPHQRASIAEGTPTLSKSETVLCGASAGVVSRFVIAPLDVVKIRLQMQTQRKDLSTLLRRKEAMEGAASAAGAASRQPRYKGMFSGMALIVREEGIRGLWKGNMAAEYLYLTYSGIQFLVYQQTKVFLKKSADVSAQKAVAVKTIGSSPTTSGAVVAVPLSAFSTIAGSSAVQSFIAGANAGIIATACTYPFDLLRTRFAIQRDIKVYTGIIQACRHIYRADGLQGFYRGMTPALIQVIPYMGIMFGSYDTLKHLASWLKKKAGVESSYSKRTITASSGSGPAPSDKDRPTKTVGQFLLGLEDLLCGALSGVISKTGVYPLDMVRKRLQIQGSEQQKSMAASSVSGTTSGSKAAADKLPTTVWRCMVHIAQREGYLALYKGLLPGLLKAAPASAVTFLVFSQAGALVEKYRRTH
ncbi:mitochondrial thiamine pyrophosphate transporter [Linnemannia exigua]|uniref:Mitochondrial thiamine pyrophosphate transporter n=1 Tax=Linnemannia exigua TaxID=604196 RepID=A0AAD4DC89_9FUNG|nr:mitochondrial thiamine pyrophosphate transporter [Linnemannia exigua]